MVNQSIPRSTVIPELAYADIGEAVRWLCDAFGFTVRLTIANHRAQLNVGDGATTWIGTTIGPPTTYPYGERQYTVEDPGGHIWNFTQSVANVRPEEWGGVSGALN